MRCAIYCRVSSDAQREKHTIASQLRLLPQFAKKEGWTVVETYVDDGLSAETVEGRPAFQRVLADAEAKLFDILLVIGLDRLTRAKSSAEGALIYDHLRECGVKLAQPGQGLIDLNNEDQDFMVGILRELGKWEKRKLIARTRRGKVEAAKQGRRASSLDPYGLVWSAEARAYLIEPTEAKTVRRMYELAIKGEGLTAIAQTLRVEGHKTRAIKRRSRPDGKPGLFVHNSIRKILRSTTYRGEFLQFVRTEKIAIPVPPIVTRADWDLAQEGLTGRRSEARWKHDRQYLLAGLATCGVCNRAMWVNNAKGYVAHKSSAYYRCAASNGWRRAGLDGPCSNRHHRVDTVDLAVWRQVQAVLSTPALLRTACALGQKKEPDLGAQAEGAEALLKGLDRQAADTLRRARKGLITDGLADEALAEIAKERRTIQKMLDRVTGRLSSQSTRTSRVEAIEAQAATLAKTIMRASFDERRSVMRLLIPRAQGCRVILCSDGSIEIRGILPLPGQEGPELTASVPTPNNRVQK